ncbi:MAG: PAS domain S-box protein [Bacteroidota bacterium]
MARIPLSATIRATCFGATFGLLFPAGAILSEGLRAGHFELGLLLQALMANPLFWLLLAVPAVIVNLAFYLGRQQASLETVRRALQAHIQARNQELASVSETLEHETTERAEVAKALEQTEARYRQLVEDATDIIFRADAQGRLSYINTQGLTRFGMTEDELLGKHFTFFISPDFRRAATERYIRQFKQGIVDMYYEFPFIPATGESAWIGLRTRLLRDEHGRVLGFQGVGRDITERRQAEHEVRQLRDFYEEILQNVPAAVAVFDTKGRYRFLNPQAIGNPEVRAELIGKTDVEYCQARDLDTQTGQRRLDKIVEVIENKRSLEYEETFDTPKGTRHFLRRLSPVQDAKERVVSVVGYGVDVTKLKEAEDRVRQQDRLLRAAARISQALLTESAFDTALERAFSILGKASDADRVYLYEARLGGEETAERFMQRYVWQHHEHAEAPPVPQMIQAVQIPSWMRHFREQVPVAGHVNEFQAEERALLEQQAAVSVLLMPIYIEGQFWGFVGFDDCEAERYWSDSERNILQSAANSIAHAMRRQQDQAVLEENEERFRAMFEQAAVGVARLSTSGKWLHLNRRFADTLGYTPNEIRGRRFDDLIHPDDVAACQALREQLSAGDTHHAALEVRYQGAHDRLIWCNMSLSMVQSADGTRYFVLVIEDITERKQAEDALQRSEALLSVSQSIANVGSWDWDISTNLVQWSENLYRLQRIEPGDVRPSFKAFINWIHPDDRDMVVGTLHSCIERRKTFVSEARMVRSDGTQWTAFLKGDLEFNSAGMPTRVLGIAQDVTEQKEAEQRLQQRLLLEQSLASISKHFVQEEANFHFVLEQLGLTLRSDRAFIFRLDSDRLESTHEWCFPGAQPLFDGLPPLEARQFPWALPVLERGEVVTIEDMSTLPEAAQHEQAFFGSLGVTALLLVPVRLQSGHLYGFVGLDHTQGPRHWQAEDVRQLRVVSDMVTGHLAREDAEQALIGQQRKLDRILNSLPINIYEKDASGAVTFVNEQTLKFTGRATGDFLGHNEHDVFDDAVAEQLLSEEAALRSSGEGQRVSEMQVTLDGEPRYLFSGRVLVEPEQPERSPVLTFSLDITDRKRIEHEVEAQQAFIRNVIDTDPSLIFVKDAEGRFKLVNQAVADLFGVTIDALVGQKSGTEEALYLDRQVLESRQAITVEESMATAEGEVRWFETVMTPIELANGEFNILGISVDITDRKQAEEALRDSRDRYSSVVDTVKDVVFQTDAGGQWTFLNPAWTEILGYAVDESLGQPIADFVAEAERVQLLNALDELRTGTRDYCRLELPFATCMGTTRWLEVFARMNKAGGEVAGLSGTLHDVTKRRQAMETMAVALSKERELGELKTRFVSMASHELRTPLAAIQSSADLLERFNERWNAERRAKLFGRIQENVKHMTSLLEDVLVLGKSDAGQMKAAPVEMDVRELAEKVAAELDLSMGSAHTFNVSIPEAPIVIEADPKLVRLVLTNLLSNAFKYSDPGQTVTFTVEHELDEVICAVSDQGIGIPEADFKHLFQPFHRASNVEARPGTGLGLSIVKRAVEMHGGRIDVDSVVNEGTTFTVSFPAQALRIPAALKPSTSPSPITAP